MLAKTGIRSEMTLRKMGAVEACALVRKSGGNPGKNLLYAIHGALHNLSWCELISSQVRSQLLIDLELFEETFSD